MVAMASLDSRAGAYSQGKKPKGKNVLYGVVTKFDGRATEREKVGNKI
jgi:hypothetical protein